jgi:hypothetical protein
MKVSRIFVSCFCMCSLMWGSLPLTYAVNAPPQDLKRG